jgi:hypothetical protein
MKRIKHFVLDANTIISAFLLGPATVAARLTIKQKKAVKLLFPTIHLMNSAMYL